MNAPFVDPLSPALNHVLRSAPLALERLARHAGRTVGFRVGPARFAFTVQTTGEVTAALAEAPRDLEVRISPFLVPRLAARDEAAWRDIEMTGDMELAHEISFLFRHLTWDVEEDLSRVVGDIAAHRIASAARSLDRWARDASLRLAQGAAEYWTEESPMIASRVKVEGFVRDVSDLRDAVDRLEKRIERLE
ncbi:MAG TPA: ubiquinone biosynthesis protein [Usitatibacter sp.]|nr:ubiquinone biosynthesis protein [Usitatibacter sp.]